MIGCGRCVLRDLVWLLRRGGGQSDGWPHAGALPQLSRLLHGATVVLLLLLLVCCVGVVGCCVAQRLLLLLHGLCEPEEALPQSYSRVCDGWLYVHDSSLQRAQIQRLAQLLGADRLWQVRLVGDDEHHRVLQLLLLQNAVQLLARDGQALHVVAVDHEHDAGGAVVVMTPERTQTVLPRHVPHQELERRNTHRLHVEADRRNRTLTLAHQLIQDGYTRARTAHRGAG